MRAPTRTGLALGAALAGCLSAPTGRDPGAVDAAATMAWPPAGASIEAIAAGDVDGDGMVDLVAVDVAGGRVHLLLGGVDLDPTRAAVTTATASAAIAGLRAPVAATVSTVGAARFIVVLDTAAAGPRLSVFDMQLRPTGTTMITGVAAPTAADVVTAAQTTFGGAMDATFFTFPTAVAFVEGDRLDDAAPMVERVPPTGTTFAGLIAATGYLQPLTPPVPRVVVAAPTLTQTGDAPTQGVFVWSPVRSGATWSAQVFAEVTGDGFPDLVGFDPAGTGASLCVLDVQTGANPPCFATQFGMNSAQLAVGPVAGVGQRDVILLDTPPAGGQAALFAVPRLRIMGNAVVADGFGAPLPLDLPAPRLALGQLDSGPAEILVMGRDGRVVCARASGVTVSRCAP